MTKSLWLVVLLAVGCTDEPRRFSLYGFDDNETEVIQGAAAEWCTASSYCPLVYGGDNSIELRATMPGQTNELIPAGRTQRVDDLTFDGDTTILILDRRSNPGWLRLLRTTVLHELGHAGGCHAHTPGTVMAANESETVQHLTQSDIDCVR